MDQITTIAEMQAWADARVRRGRRTALVPTMGALHKGHLKLVEEAAGRADDVVVSVFVNPTQFGPGEDYERYPRDIEADAKALHAIDPSITLFVPRVAEMYPDGPSENRTWVSVEGLDEHLCGRFREGHFRGVTTVVMKLLHACKPDLAVFGLKDAQQFVILKRMVRDMLVDVEVVGVPTVRDHDGLAFSSRNAYLNANQRDAAKVLSEAIFQAERHILEGEQHSGALVESMRSMMERADGIDIQYVELVDAETLQPVGVIEPGTRVLAAVAAYFGSTRLIDSVFACAPLRDRGSDPAT